MWFHMHVLCVGIIDLIKSMDPLFMEQKPNVATICNCSRYTLLTILNSIFVHFVIKL